MYSDCNRLVDLLESHYPEFSHFTKSLGLVKDPFNNKDYNGNGCNKIMKFFYKLEEVIPEALLPILDTLKALQNVKSSCFGPKLSNNYKEDIIQFEEKWMQLYIYRIPIPI